MKRNLFTLAICAALIVGLFSCSGGDVKKSKEYLALKAELDKIKSQDSLAEANIATYKKMNDDFMNGEKEDFLDAIADNYVDHNPDTAMTKKTGKAACEEGFDIINSAFSGMSLTYVHIYAEGDMVYCHATMNGKNTGAMGPNMPATNNSYKDVEFYEIAKIENGKCTERWGLMDFQTMMMQLGAPAM
jgi:predicted SnoaL-like aldol condensation-catalyzing enzyme